VDVIQLRKHANELNFEPQDQVRWFAPLEMVRIGVKVFLSTLFADYADRREVQAALPAAVVEVPTDDAGGAWFDMVADLGDGFDATYSVALLVAADQLDVADPSSRQYHLPRADLLVFGGDEVYPTASARAYEDRTKGPYRAALPTGTLPPAHRPMMLALPGNHDWYDGLTAFLRVFGQQRNLGDWQTMQTRSYFAVRLPGNWWLAGVDTQLGTYIDFPQIRYFKEHLSRQLQPGDGVIIVAPTPAWVHTVRDPDAFNSLEWFEQNIVEQVERNGVLQPTGAKVRLWLTGDSHHYARYVESHPELPDQPLPTGPPPDQPDLRAPTTVIAPVLDQPATDEPGPDQPGLDQPAADRPPVVDGAARQFVTCGLGGAFLTETHNLPTALRLPHPDSRMAPRHAPVDFDLAARWPEVPQSRALARRIIGLGRFGLAARNPGLLTLCGAVQSTVAVVLLLVLAFARSKTPIRVLREVAWQAVLPLAGQVAVWLLLLVLAVVLVPVVRGRRPQLPWQPLAAIVAQLAVALAVLGALLWLMDALPWADRIPDWVVGLGSLALVFVVGGWLSSWVLAVSILLSTDHLVQGWQMAAQADEERKGFLRLRVDGDGVTVYPVVVDAVCHDWRLEGNRPMPTVTLQPRLVEAPYRVARSKR